MTASSNAAYRPAVRPYRERASAKVAAIVATPITAAKARAVQSVSWSRSAMDSMLWNSSGWARKTGNIGARVVFPASAAAEPV